MIEVNSSTGINTEFPLVSVIMNCYNSAKYLHEAIDSVLDQTYSNWELIFWDNQSSDESAEIFKSYRDQRMRYFYAPEHTVLGEARNRAVEQAKGEWLGFLDCDDIWLPEKLEKQIAMVPHEVNELGLIYGKASILIEENGKSTTFGKGIKRNSINLSCPEGWIFPTMLKSNPVLLLTALVRRTAYIEVGGCDTSFNQAEDYDLFVKVVKRFKASAIQNYCCIYRIHATNISHKQIERSYLESIEVVKKYLPNPDAKAGIRIWQAKYAGHLFKNGRFKDGFFNLITSREFFYFLKMTTQKLISMTIFRGHISK